MSVLEQVVSESLRERDTDFVADDNLIGSIQKSIKRGIEFDIVAFMIVKENDFIRLVGKSFNYNYNILALQELEEYFINTVGNEECKFWMTADICYDYLVKNINGCKDIESFLLQTPWTVNGTICSKDENDNTIKNLLDLNSLIESETIKFYNPIMGVFWEIPFCSLNGLQFSYSVTINDIQEQAEGVIAIDGSFTFDHVEKIYNLIFNGKRKGRIVLKNLTQNKEFTFYLTKLFYVDSYRQCINEIIRQIITWECIG